MNKPLKSDTPKAEMKINVQGYKVTLCFAEPDTILMFKIMFLTVFKGFINKNAY